MFPLSLALGDYMRCNGICCTLKGLLLLVAGAVLLLSGLGMLDGVLATLVAGASIALVGLAGLVHSVGACPLCKCK